MKKAEAFKDCYGEELYNKIEWVQADLADEEALNRAVEGCSHILHVASPIPSETTKVSNAELVKMAVSGMRTILKACKQFGVKKLVVTSSCATINGTAWKGKADPNYSDEDFAFGKPGQRLDGYMESKVMQEQECINWLKENQDTEIVTLHPSFIIGPCLNSFASSSIEGIKKLSDGSIPVVPQLHLPSIDVRDCAQAHINALLAPAGTL